ncbi:MAG: glycosyltransferase [Erysipelotrichaceae bacterium]|nr:glycosyltransferase [Erysipelotrichaceae bacterium]
MTRVLFLCGQLKLGGVQRSLLSLIENLDTSDYDVSLLLDELNGDLFKELPCNVKIIKLNEELNLLHKMNLHSLGTWAYLLKHPTLLYIVFKYFLTGQRSINKKNTIQNIWDIVKNKYSHFYDEYNFDVVISYAGSIGLWNQYAIDLFKAKKKICWIHGDYSVFCTGSEKEKKYIMSFDTIVTVSATIKKILLRFIPEIQHKTIVINNIVNKEKLLRLADEYSPDLENGSKTRFISVSRLDKNKGFDLAIKAFSKVVNSGYDICWDIIGQGSEMEKLSLLIDRLEMRNNIRLLGKKNNPYPFLKVADVFFHPSKGEGKSIAVDEAKLMSVPVLITSYPSVTDQITNGYNGIIVDISETALIDGIIEMTTNEQLREKLKDNLRKADCSESSIKQVKKLLSCEYLNENH